MPDSWIVGLIMSAGEHRTLTNEEHVVPSDVDSVVFPLSIPWRNDPVFYDVPLKRVETTERNMGTEEHYSAWVEDTVPNSDQIWEIELELWEYPTGAFNMSRLSRSDQIRNAEFDSSDLLDIMEDRY